jgi:uracil-DNA glycosylase
VTAPPVPDRPTLPRLRTAVQDCRACELWQGTTQAVLGAGSSRARVMFVGEQPGDREDREGEPFTGPAGALLDRALEEAGIDRRAAYVTNVVKHFRYKARGKRRIHQRPDASHIAACRPWLDAELALIKPEVLVCLGATAAQALLGRQFRVSKNRGVPVESDLAPVVMATVHPSSILRSENREAETALLVEDLRRVAEALRSA